MQPGDENEGKLGLSFSVKVSQADGPYFYAPEACKTSLIE
jgi:hypothetical protein